MQSCTVDQAGAVEADPRFSGIVGDERELRGLLRKLPFACRTQRRGLWPLRVVARRGRFYGVVGCRRRIQPTRGLSLWSGPSLYPSIDRRHYPVARLSSRLELLP